jgi:hypothetical protein
MDSKYDVFLSFARGDRARARRLYAQLTELGFRCWFDEAQIQLGASVIGMIRNGLTESRIVLVLHSRRRAASEWALFEQDSALHHEVQQRTVRVVVLLLDDSPLPVDIGRKKYLRLGRGKNALRELEQFLASISAETIRSVEATFASGHEWVACAHRLGDMARYRNDIEALHAVCRILEAIPQNYNVADSAAWSLGYIAIWTRDARFVTRIKATVKTCVRSGNARMIDKMAYICGEMVLNAIDPRLKTWADRLIDTQADSENEDIAQPFMLTRKRVRGLLE